MRIVVVSGLLVALGLSGCLGFGDEGEHDGDKQPNTGFDDCPEQGDDAMVDDAASEEGNGSVELLQIPLRQQNETLPTENNETYNPEIAESGATDCPGDVPVGPNELPIPVLALSSNGVVLDDFTAIYPGDSILFSAVGTSDPDGEVDLIGLTVKDANSTRNVNLMEDGAFVDATLVFDHVGPINLTMRVLDDRGEGVVLHRTAAVNLVVEDTAETVVAVPADDVADCEPAESGTSQTLTNSEHWYAKTFSVTADTRWISVTTSGDQSVGICSPDGTSLATGTGSAMTADQTWPAGIDYRVVATPAGANESFTVRIEVHYEAQPAS